VRFRFAGTGAIYKWEFKIGERLVEYEVAGNLTISDTVFTVEAAEGNNCASIRIRLLGMNSNNRSVRVLGPGPSCTLLHP
jgi:hypothetical protein